MKWEESHYMGWYSDLERSSLLQLEARFLQGFRQLVMGQRSGRSSVHVQLYEAAYSVCPIATLLFQVDQIARN